MQLEQEDIPQLQKAILDINNNYLHGDKVANMQFADVPLPNTEIWQRAKAAREQGFTRRFQIGGNYFNWYISNGLEAVLHELDIALAGGLIVKENLREKDEHPFFINAVTDESIASAQLSGHNIAKKTAREMLLKKRPEANKNEQATYNIFQAVQQLGDAKNEPLSPERLLQMQQQLGKNVLRKKSVEAWRAKDTIKSHVFKNIPGYALPPVATLPDAMQQFCDFYNDVNQTVFIHPVVKSAIIHYLVIYLKPFADGNGRLARLLAHGYLLRKGYWVMDYISVTHAISRLKPQYSKTLVLSASDGNQLGYFIHYYIQCLRMAYPSLRQSLQKKVLQASVGNFKKVTGLNERQAAVLQWLTEDAAKIVTIRELRSGFGVSKETARTDLNLLQEKGFLKTYNLNKKTYAFIKGDGFDAMIHEIPKRN
ncbi:MAG: Fic family protein [Niabella sp.]